MGTRASAMLAALALAVAAVVGACGDHAAAVSAPPSSLDAGGDAPSDVPLCVDGKPTAAYPPGPYELGILGTLPPGLSFVGTEGPVAMSDYFEPCAARSRIVVVRSSAAWCGPCLWHAAQTARFVDDPRLAGRVLLVELLIADHDNVPAKPEALASWGEKLGVAGVKLAVDPKYTFGPAQLGRSPLPGYVFIDTRTMQIVGTMSDPDPESLVAMLAVELADADDVPRPPLPSPTLFDGHFTENEIALVRGMKLGNLAPPPDPTNEYGDDPAAVAFGKVLFSDALLSPSGKVSCATCHDLAHGLTDGAAQSTGVAKVDRNSPAIALSAHARWQFWDGRADTLWMQALGPLEDAKEFGGSRLFVAHQIAERHSAAYTAVFGAKYPLPNLAALPANGKPGDPAYDALSASDKEAVTRIFVNGGKALAAFERAMRVKPNALDRYADGDVSALTPDQKHGLTVFLRNGCVQCHWGPRLTDDAFHALRFPTGRQDGKADLGREDGLLRLSGAEFLASSSWSDSPSSAKPFALDEPMLGAFKTPTLRGLPTSAPYGHGGTFAMLLQVSEHYGKRGLEHGDAHAVGTTEQWVPTFDMNAVHALPAFLDVLSADVELP